MTRNKKIKAYYMFYAFKDFFFRIYLNIAEYVKYLCVGLVESKKIIFREN